MKTTDVKSFLLLHKSRRSSVDIWMEFFTSTFLNNEGVELSKKNTTLLFYWFFIIKESNKSNT